MTTNWMEVRETGTVNDAVYQSVHNVVYATMDAAVGRAMSGPMRAVVRTAMPGGVLWVVYWDVDDAMYNDPQHPVLSDFLSRAGEEAP
jgi:hypothetical protein